MKFSFGFITFIVVVVCINSIYGYPAIDNDETVNLYSDSKCAIYTNNTYTLIYSLF